MDFEIAFAASSLDREQAQDLRRSVLCGELHWPREVVEDKADGEAMLALVSLGAKPIATARLIEREGAWHLELLAVLERFRGQGVGAALVAALEACALEQEAASLRVMAPGPAKAYFEKLGYKAAAGGFLEKWLSKGA